MAKYEKNRHILIAAQNFFPIFFSTQNRNANTPQIIHIDVHESGQFRCVRVYVVLRLFFSELDSNFIYLIRWIGHLNAMNEQPIFGVRQTAFL